MPIFSLLANHLLAKQNRIKATKGNRLLPQNGENGSWIEMTTFRKEKDISATIIQNATKFRIDNLESNKKIRKTT